MKPEPADPQLGADGLTVEEVGALWSFLHGDIMIGGIRQRIREHWGLCARHAWGHAVVEIELWEVGAGARGGHQPFEIGVLYNDLLEAMRTALAAHSRSPQHALRRRGTCYLCAQLGGAHGPHTVAVGYAGFTSGPLAEEANTLTYTRKWSAETRPRWTARRCPVCTPELADGEGFLCRFHLLEAGGAAPVADDILDYLNDLSRRLRRLVESMTEHGEPSTATADASWVEALGWFHTWSFPNTVSAS